VGWQPSRFLNDRSEAQRAFALADQLGSVNAAATQLGTTWPSLRKAFTRHGLGMPARKSGGRPAEGGRPPRPWIRCSWRSTSVPSRLGNGLQPSCTRGSAGTRSTPSSAPT
jgi:hypothetical protein